MTDQELLQRVARNETNFNLAERAQLLMIEKEISPGPIKDKLKKLLDTPVHQESETSGNSGEVWS